MERPTNVRKLNRIIKFNSYISARNTTNQSSQFSHEHYSYSDNYILSYGDSLKLEEKIGLQILPKRLFNYQFASKQ